MLRFTPIYKAVPWGGNRLANELGRRTPPGDIGESWELVDIDGHESRVLRGPQEGKSLGELWRAGAVGGAAEGRFPFLVKWIDTRQKLSVQVHPDDAAVARLGKGAPKTEAWYIAQAEPGSTLLAGHYPGLDAATLRAAATGGTVAKWLYEVRPRVGEMLLVPAGTLHAIGAGLFLLEVQQPSDTTFRLYDWGRLDAQGRPRPLHIDEGCQAVAYARPGPPKPERELLRGPSFSMQQLRAGAEVPPDRLRVFAAHQGPARLVTQKGEEALAYGDVVVAEPSDGTVGLLTGAAMLLSEP